MDLSVALPIRSPFGYSRLAPSNRSAKRLRPIKSHAEGKYGEVLKGSVVPYPLVLFSLI